MDVEQVKEANRIEDVISETYPLRGSGRYLRAEQHDSLVVDSHNQAYFWNSQDEHGDVIDWIERREKCSFRAAAERLCQRAGLPAPQWHTEDAQAVAAHRARCDALTLAARHFVRTLRGDQGQVACDYCHGRGWTDETIQRAGLGYADGDRKSLQGTFSMYEIDPAHPAAQAALGIRAGMLVYPHVEHGRVAYLATRSIGEKRHYNPPVELIGERRLYFNWEYNTQADQVVVVEGQADAITLAQWGIPAMALAGVAVNQVVLKVLARHKRVYVALDPDEAGTLAARKMADALGPLTRLVSWPEKDANAWLQAGATANDCAALLAAAPTWVEVLVREAAQAENSDREAKLEHFFSQFARLGQFTRATLRRDLASKMGLGLREFNTLLKAIEGQENQETEDGEVVITRSIVGGMIETKEGYYLAETIYTPSQQSETAITISSGKTALAFRDPSGEIHTAPDLVIEGKRYCPPPPNSAMLQKRVLTFAEDVGPLLSARELIDEIQETIHRYVDLSPFFERLSAYYVLLTWFYDAFKIVPYLRFRGDYGTGKSRARKVIGGLCYRPTRASGASSEASLFRILDAWRGTLLLEEADFEQSDYAQPIMKMLNISYDREQGVILRCGDRTKNFEAEAYVTYGPKVLAMRGQFTDEAAESRCLTEQMGITTRTDIPVQLPSSWTEEAARLQGLLLRYRLERWQPVIEVDCTLADLSVEPRLNQITLPLYSVIDDDELREDLREFVQSYYRQIVAERSETLEARVLEALVIQVEIEKSKIETERDLSVGTIAGLVNHLINYSKADGDIERAVSLSLGSDSPQVHPRRVGTILRRDFGLMTEYRVLGKMRRNHVVYDAEAQERIATLRRRFDLDDETVDKLIEICEDIDAKRQAQKASPEQGKLNL